MKPWAWLSALGAGLLFFRPKDAAASSMSSGELPDQVGDQVDSFFQYDSLFLKWGKTYGVPPSWLKAIAMNESQLGQDERVKNGQVSTDGKSWGLMQVTLRTAQLDLDPAATPAKLNDPAYSIRLASIYLSRLYKTFRGDQRKVIMSYNQGPGNTQAGKEYAADYYARFQRNLERIKARQPDFI